MDEFELIRRYFVRQNEQHGVVTGIGDDGAVLTPDPDLDQVQVIDTLVEGIHFPADAKPFDIASRAVAVNLSDLAAMGARPRWMTLALSIPEAREKWLADFAAGLFAAADEFGVALVGGDTTSAPSIVVTVAMTGEVPKGGALSRAGARPGDTIYVTGTVGDAAAGLELLKRGDDDAFLVSRYLRPTPRVATGRALLGKASSAIDISDGLVGDLKKLLTASGTGATIDVDRVPLSAALSSNFDTDARYDFAMTGGDDYELCFTANVTDVDGVAGITAIGEVTRAKELVILRAGNIVDYDDSGYRHFQ